MPVNQLSAIDLKAKFQANEPIFLLDVREPEEFDYAHIEGSLLIPINALPAHLSELDSTQEIVVICHHGMRSMQAAQFLDRVGFKKISNLAGGIDAWSVTCDASVKRY